MKPTTALALAAAAALSACGPSLADIEGRGDDAPTAPAPSPTSTLPQATTASEGPPPACPAGFRYDVQQEQCVRDCPAGYTVTEEGCVPPPCSWTVSDCGDWGCNGHLGDDEAACRAAGNHNPLCTEEIFTAWCTRRVDAWPTRWESLHKSWVDDRCGGAVTLNGNSYVCEEQESCTRYKCTTPLVLAFDASAPVRYTARPGARAFPLDVAGGSTDWPTSATPWLALDRDGDGRITSGRELFGTLSAPELAESPGFAALAALDANRDGEVDARDPAFARLLVWADDGDRVSQPGELRRLSELGVRSLSLDWARGLRCDRRGNCERERATFRWAAADGRVRLGALVDVHLAVREEARLACLP